jgi:hypothetical protein
MNAKTFVVFLLAAGLLTVALPPAASIAWAEEPANPPQAAPELGIVAEVVETESGIYYTVKEGDTLWDLSRKFANSPYIWPDMWSDNSQIANPHRIYPGERIQLYRREDVKQMPAEQPAAEPAAVAIETQPPPEPPSEPSPQQEAEPPAEEEKYVTFSRIDQVGFIRKPPVDPHGKIISVLDNREMIATDNIVYIRRQRDQTLIPGNRYTIYRTPNKVYDKKTGKYLGTQHYLLGFVRILRVEKDDYAVGKIERAFLNIGVGDMLMPYRRRSIDLTRRKPPSDIAGEIIMAEVGNLIIGDNVIAFINRGTEHGVQVGQVYNLFYQKSGRLNPKSNRTITLGSIDFGEFIVLLTEDSTSTVLITKAKQDIQPGTRFHAPQL